MNSCKLTLSDWRLHCCVYSRSTLPCVLTWIWTFKSQNPAIPSRNLVFLIVFGPLFPGSFLLFSFVDHGAPCVEEMKLPWGKWQRLSLCGQEQSGLQGFRDDLRKKERCCNLPVILARDSAYSWSFHAASAFHLHPRNPGEGSWKGHTHLYFFLISYRHSAADRRVNAGWAASQRAALSSSPKLYSLGWVIRFCSVMSLDSRTGTTVVLSVGLLRNRVNGGSLPTQCLNTLKYDNMRAGTSLALVSSYPCPHPEGHCALSIPRDAVCPHLPTLNWGCFLQWIAFPITADHEAAASQLLLVYTHELGLLLVARPS